MREQLLNGEFNFNSRPLRLELEELAQLQLPCILHWDLNHFVVLKKVGSGSITILDPAVGERKLPMARGIPALHRRGSRAHAQCGLQTRRPD